MSKGAFVGSWLGVGIGLNAWIVRVVFSYEELSTQYQQVLFTVVLVNILVAFALFAASVFFFKNKNKMYPMVFYSVYMLLAGWGCFLLLQRAGIMGLREGSVIVVVYMITIAAISYMARRVKMQALAAGT